MDFNILELLKKAINPIKQGIQHPIEAIKGQMGEVIGNDLPSQGGIFGNMKPQGGEMFGMPANMAQQNVGNSALMNAIKGSPDTIQKSPYPPIGNQPFFPNSPDVLPETSARPNIPFQPNVVGQPPPKPLPFGQTPNTITGDPKQKQSGDRVTDLMDYYEQLRNYDPKEDRLKSALFGAAYGGFQGLANGGDWQSGLAGAATGGGIGLAQPKFYGQFKRQQQMSETDDALQRAIKGEQAILNREGTLADIEGRRAQTEDIKSRPQREIAEREAKAKESAYDRALQEYGIDVNAIGRGVSEKNRMTIAQMNDKTRQMIADKNNKVRIMIADNNNRVRQEIEAAKRSQSEEQFKAKYPRAGQSFKLSEIKAQADKSDIPVTDLIEVYQSRGAIIDLDN